MRNADRGVGERSRFGLAVIGVKTCGEQRVVDDEADVAEVVLRRASGRVGAA
jgi:hypothetical protein